MADENNELDQLDPSLKGLIIDEDQSAKNTLWITLGLIFSLAIIVTSWIYLSVTKTEEETLKERLSNYEQVSSAFKEYSRAIQSSPPTSKELRLAVAKMIELSNTPLRLSHHPQAPYIPERQMAFIFALEGLLRLELEGGLQFEYESDYNYFQNQLKALGQHELEYYENGMLQQIPLLHSAWFQKKLDEENTRKSPDPMEVEYLESSIEEYLTNESFSIVGPALRLGKWYRYHNDLPNAMRCFEIGRRYIEGYESKSRIFEGKSPKQLNPLWEEYAQCLEAMTETAIQRGQFRQARFYLSRLFVPPSSTTSIHVLLEENKATQSNYEVQEKLEHDIAVVRRSISSPLDLNSFPQYQLEDDNINWSAMKESLRTAHEPSASEVDRFFWEHSSEDCKQWVLSDPPVEISPEIKQQIISSLNQFVFDSEFFNQVHPQESLLSYRSQDILKKSKIASLTQEEYSFLNRNILDNNFENAIKNTEVLSDGTHLNNKLSPLQRESYNSFLSTFQEENLANLNQFPHEKEATLRDYHLLLKNKIDILQQEIANLNEEQENQAQALKTIRREVHILERENTIDIDRIMRIQKDESLAQQRQVQIELLKQQNEQEIAQLQTHLSQLVSPLQSQLKQLQAQLESLKDTTSLTESKQASESTISLIQIEQQIDLQSKYLSLLKELKTANTNHFIEDLFAENKSLQLEVTQLQKQAEQQSGDQLEETLYQMDLLIEKQSQSTKTLDKHLSPLREITQKIANVEQEAQNIHEELKTTQTEILRIIGIKGSPGSLQEKTEQRAHLLLQNPESSDQAVLVENEIHRLNQQISQEHAKLNVLLQKERSAKEKLEVYYPDLQIQSNNSKNVNTVSKLNNYLTQHAELMNQYNNHWEQRKFLKRIKNQEEQIIENLNLISDQLASIDITGNKISSIHRYMKNVVRAQNRLKHYQRQLRRLEKSSSSHTEAFINRGYLLDSVALYEMEEDLGIKITQFHHSFQERDHILTELRLATQRKNELDAEKVVATRNREQFKIDQLIPLVSEAEKEIGNLTEELKRINKQLNLLVTTYEQQLRSIQQRRQETLPQTNKRVKHLQILSQTMADKDSVLDSLNQEMFTSVDIVRTTTQVLTDGKVSEIDALIEKQENELIRLGSIYDAKHRENYYKSLALWLTGKTLYEQSRLNNFDALITASAIDPLLELETIKEFTPLHIEFDHEFLGSDEMFGEAFELDHNRANYSAWLNYLEQEALRIFNIELPRFALPAMNPYQSNSHQMSSENYLEDLKAITARSRFLIGKIHVKRALRFIRTLELEASENKQAYVELSSATSAFLNFLDFSLPYSYSNTDLQAQLTERRIGSQEFPQSKRQQINLINDAKIYLGIITYLKDEYHQAIEYYRSIMGDLISNLPDEFQYSSLFQASGVIDPILQNDFPSEAHSQILFDSLLARSPTAHEVLYRLGQNYQALAEESFKRTRNSSTNLQDEIASENEKFHYYSKKAIAYFSQLILTQAYSPYRKSAQLQRARIYTQLNNYEQAHTSLISILGSPSNEGGSFSMQQLTEKGDLPGDLNPGYAYVSFELGKLHLQHNNFSAAATAFLQTEKSSLDFDKIAQAKSAYAQTLIASEQWVPALLILSELEQKYHLLNNEQHSDLLVAEIQLDLGSVQQKIGNLVASIETLQKVMHIAPGELIQNNKIDINNELGLRRLKSDFRDTIRPLAQACLTIAQAHLQLREFDPAREMFQSAEALYRLTPWKEDRLLRDFERRDYLDYRNLHLLKARWGQLKTDADELIFTTLNNFREAMDEQSTFNKRLSAEDMQQSMEDSIALDIQQQNLFKTLAKKIQSFYEAEYSRLPEIVEQESIAVLQELDRQSGGQNLLSYKALSRIRNTLIELENEEAEQIISYLTQRFENGGLEERLISTFTLHFATQNQLNSNESKLLHKGDSPLASLPLIPSLQINLNKYPEELRAWIEGEMRESGLDDTFIQVSAQASILEEVQLYNASILSHLENRDSYQDLSTIINKVISSTQAKPNRITQPTLIWQTILIGALSAEYQQDWRLAEKTFRYLLQDEQETFFASKDRSDMYQTQLGLARALLNLSEQEMNDSVFASNLDQKKNLEQSALEKKDEATKMLAELSRIQGNNPIAITTRMTAKQLLNKLNI